jgi:hypothetical protein
MSTPANCVTRVTTAMAGKVSQAQATQIQQQLALLQQQLQQQGVSPSQAVHQAGRQYAQQVQLAKLIAKRNATINALRYQALSTYLDATWAGRESEGLRAILTGSIEGRKGARQSVSAEQRWLRDHYLGGLETELTRAGVRDLFKTGVLDRDVARALWQLNSKQPNVASLPADAVKIARAVHKWQELARMHANQAGAFIGKLEGWVVRQSHDAYRITQAGEAAWIQKVAPLLDWQRIELERGPIADKVGWLQQVYSGVSTGMHAKTRAAPNTSGFKGPRNLAKGMSEERVLHFRDADAWFDYNAEFGAGNLREAAFRGLMRAAQDTGVMRVLGTNPEAMFERLADGAIKRLRRTGDDAAMKKLGEARSGWLKNRLDEVTGAVNAPVDSILARRAATVRALQSMAKLGGAVISSVTDLANFASEMRFQGRGFLNGIGEAIGGLVQGRPAGERREILSSLGVFFDSLIGDITRTGTLDETMPGAVGRAQQMFFKLNLLNWWTDSLRGSAALSMSHHLALNAGKAFDQLSPDLQRVFGFFNIKAADWDHMRSAGVKRSADGTDFLVPDSLDPARADQLRRYINDRAYTAVLEPDADSRALLRQGTRPGTPSGELWRFLTQFKGYPVAFTRQVIGREIYGYGDKAFGQGSLGGLASLMLTTTVLGYGAQVTKDLLKGRTPRDPTEPSTITAAMLQGGGAGIYGDFLFADFSRFGRTPLETLAGPTLSTAADVVQLGQGLVRGNRDAGDALRLALDNTPYMNLFYTRIALNYLFLYQVQEALSPGTLRRMEQRIERENAQTFWLPPSESVR